MNKNQNSHEHMNNFNIDNILNDIDLIVKTGLNRLLKDYMDRYTLLEETHNQIMKLPSVVHEFRSLHYDENIFETDFNDDLTSDKSLSSNIQELAKEVVNEKFSQIEDKLNNLESKYELLFPILNKFLEKIEVLSEEINDIKHIKHKEADESLPQPTIESKENIKLEFYEDETVYDENNQEPKVEEEEDEVEEDLEEEVVEEDVEEATEKEVVEEEDEEEDAEDEAVEEAEDEEEEEETSEAEEAVEAEEEADDEAEDEDEDEAEAEAEDEDEEEEEEASEKEAVEDVKDEEDEEEAEEKAVEENVNPEDEVETENDDEEDFFEVEIKNTTYATNNEVNGFIYDITDDGEIGKKVGYYKNKTPFFYANEK